MLTLVATPIGNLDDLSLRAARALVETDVILAEDTRSVKALLERAQSIVQSTGYKEGNTYSPFPSNTHQHPSQKIVSYFKDVEFEKLPEIIAWLEQGLHVALVSKAGMPVMSDPGQLLVHTARRYNVPVTVIPGPSSVDTAIAISGLKFDHTFFAGFVPKRDGARSKLIKRLFAVHSSFAHDADIVFVLFETHDRIGKTLNLLYTSYPGITVVLCREMTKIHEEVVFQPDAQGSYRGEIVLLIQFPQTKREA